MAARRPPTETEARYVRAAVEAFGARSWTTRYLGIGRRDVDRMLRLARGEGRITEDEARRIREAGGHVRLMSRLEDKGRKAGLRGTHLDRALLDWFLNGKRRGEPSDPERTQRAMRALAALGYSDPTKGPYRLKRLRPPA